MQEGPRHRLIQDTFNHWAHHRGQMTVYLRLMGAKVPSLWLYSENDSYFDAELSKRMVSAYGGAGGRAVYVLVGPFKEDGHTLFGDPDGRSTWTPYVASFLGALE